MKMLKRTIIVLWNIVPLILSFVRDLKRYIIWGNGRMLTEEEHTQRAKHLTKTLGYLGPTFIKLAQVLSARADVFPQVYIKELSTLQDKVDPNPTEEIKAVICEELQQPLDEIFDNFNEQPLAAASLGQVHRARYQNEEVIVKVLRPGVPKLVQIDLYILHGVLNVLDFFISDSPYLKSLTTLVNEFHRVVLQEMDFESEARNVKIFQKNFADEEFVVIPRVYDTLITKKVLVLEYLEGVKVTEIKAIEEMGLDMDTIIQRLAKIYIKQALIDGILHADPHPGNILVNQQGQIIILDFGMVIRIEESFKRHVILAAVAIAQNDIERLVNELYELQLVEPGTNKAMLSELATLILEIQEQGKLPARKVQQMMNALMDAFYEFPFVLPSELVYVFRATSLIEGIGFVHDPWFDAIAVGRPIIKEMAKDILREELQEPILDTLQAWAMQSYQTVVTFQDIVARVDREQLHLRLHLADLQSFNAMLRGAVRKILIGMFVILVGGASSVIYLRSGNIFILSLGVLFSGFCIMLLLLLPDRLPESRHRRYIRRHLNIVTTEEGELYKSFMMGQMTPEQRAEAEEKRKKKNNNKQ